MSSDTGAQPRKYWAFISYSSEDRDHAAWLIEALETYRVPRSLVGRPTASGPVPERLVPVFRDRDELRSSPDLSAALEAALRQSRFLIVLCSPGAARPASWVDREVRTFKALGRKADVLSLIVDGEPNASRRPGFEAAECFPEALRFDVDETGATTDRPVEPLAADLRREDPKPRVARRKALLKLVARIIDVEFDDLWQRDEQRRRRRRAMTLAGAATVATVIAGLAWTGVGAVRSELSGRLAEQATAELTRAPDVALLLSVAAFQTSPTAAAYGSLLQTVGGTTHLHGQITGAERAAALAFRPDGRQLAVAWCQSPECAGASIALFDVVTRQAIGSPFEIDEGAVTDLAFHPVKGTLLAVVSSLTSHRLVSIDLSGPDPIVEQIYRDSQPITTVVWSSDGRFYAVAVGEGRMHEVKLFPDGSGRRCGDLPDAPVVAMAFAPDARLLAVGSEYGQVLLVDTATCAVRRLHHQRLGGLAFDFSGRYLVAVMPDGTTTQWDLAREQSDGRRFPLIRVPLDGYLHAFTGDAALLASQDGSGVLVHDVSTVRDILERLNDQDVPGLVEETSLRLELGQLEPLRLRGHRSEPRILRFSPDGSLLATADDLGGVVIWSVGGVSIVEALSRVGEPDSDAAAGGRRGDVLSADGRLRVQVEELATGCSGDYVLECRRTTRLTLRDAVTGEAIGSLEAVRYGMSAVEASESLDVSFTSDGNVVTVGRGEDDRWLAGYLWRIDSGWLVEQACGRANRALGADAAEIRRYVQGWRASLVAGACLDRAG
jgi:WD40 repeat protein